MTQRDALEKFEQARRLALDLRALGDVEAGVSLVAGALARVGLVDSYFTVESALGLVSVAYSARGVSSVRRAASAADFVAGYRETFGRRVIPAPESDERLQVTVNRILRGEARPRLRFDLGTLSEFEQAVLLKALEIPRGEARPYAWIAREIGRPGAVRAVGSALKHNPVPLLIPCHRVVRSDGQLGEYALGGTDAKRIALRAEAVDVAQLEALAEAGVRFRGSDTTRVFCYPTCYHGRRIQPRHEIHFKSREEAQKAGYRPCLSCRPA